MCKRGFEQFVLNCGLTLLLVGCILAAASERRCPIAYRCADVEEVVWSTDGSKCFVWRNGCHLKNENCQRLNSRREELREVTKEECQEKCIDACVEIYSPVCAEYNGVRRTFSHSCALEAHICRSGKTYSLFGHAECDTN
ncbi:uncharacterized protein LOC126762524 [Bactrocera neohumeralis]|uniref:uncharacterized protein LOC126762524 n=1 Tax=Bactrocera neohumeralis TaxID=98809 RepID=UPI00216640C3|nr:uncharacterized protein LOC126762524 [Bactrocera neohumeralis]